MRAFLLHVLMTVVLCFAARGALTAAALGADLDELAGRPADIAPSAYQYRADRKAEDNPPESWILLVQYAGLPYTKPVDRTAPAIKKALCGLLWEEVRPLRQVELSWPADAKNRPAPDELTLAYFDGADDTAHTWWNPRKVREADKPKVSADGLTYVYTIPVDTWGVVALLRGPKDASAAAVPAMCALVPDVWKKLDLEIEWAFEDATAGLNYGGRIEAYDGILGGVQPLAGDSGTSMTGPCAWRSAARGGARRGVRMSVLYMGRSPWHPQWPYHAPQEDVARSILTVWTAAGNFSFLVADLERGPIFAPEYGFFVRATSKPAAAAQAGPPFLLPSQAASARDFLKELAAKHWTTVRQRVRGHEEQTWEGAVRAMFPEEMLPPHPQPGFMPPMQVDVPDARLTAQWNLGAWHLLRHTPKDPNQKRVFNDYPFGILATETYMILHALDFMGLHQEAADGLDQWLRLPMEHHITPGHGGHHPLALPDRPLGLFGDGVGCFTHAEGAPGWGDHMDGVHATGPGTIMFALAEHFRLTHDMDWLRANAPRMKANAEWLLRQRQLLSHVLPGGERLWSKGLQPAHVVTPDSACMLMPFYEGQAYYWLGVKSMAELLSLVDPAEGAGWRSRRRPIAGTCWRP